MLTRIWVGMAIAGVMASAATAAVTQVAYDGFNYANGSALATNATTGQTGGTGWADSWKLTYFDGQLRTYTPGYTYAGLSTEGGYIGYGTGGSQGISQAYRALPTMMDSDIVYVQCLFNSSDHGHGGTPQLRLENSVDQNVPGAMGLFDSPYDTKFGLAAGAERAASDVSYDTGVHLLVWQIDYENTTSKLWVDPDLSTFDYENPSATPDATGDFAPEFDGLSIYFRSGSSLDELQIMYVPEPATLMLMAAGLPILLKCRRRRG